MSSGSLARQATTLARQTLLIAFGGLALLAALSLASLLMYGASYRRAEDRSGEARAAAAQVLLADERLTMSANMAAATGEQRWIDRYLGNIPMIEEAIADAKALADPDVSARFDAETRAANDRLVAMETQAFEAVSAGALSEARAILDSEAYARDKRILSEGATQFHDSVVTDARSEVEAVTGMASTMLPLLALLVVAAGAALWRRLNATLKRSEGEIEEAETRIRDLALSDALTGVANRRALREHLKASLLRADRNRTKVALLMLDLDNFKPVNDTHGHVVGDLVLKDVALRMDSALRKGEFRARYGGDEFAIVAEDATEDGVRRVAHRLVEALCQPMRIDGVDVQIGVSIGVAMFPTVAGCPDDLLRKADVALYRAKREGRGAVRVYDLTMEVEASERAQLESDLREALVNGGLTPHFLPVIDVETGAVSAFEILARWTHARHGEVSPATFIPIVESMGLMNEMTIAVLEAACKAARALPSDVTLALNVSPAQIQDEWLAERLMKALTKTGYPAQRLQVEVSETALVLDLAAAKRVISSLKNIGVKVALDDFGSGYSSLCYLSELSFDAIKIDASFVRAVMERPESAKIVTAIVSLSKSLGVRSCAEGVETAEQAAFLRAIGCDLAQGFYYARPMPAAAAALAFSVDQDEVSLPEKRARA